jgi:ubiquinone/menaquinone biosynthesis C-methylase UbiE
MKPEGVEADTYDEDWIDAAWGQGANAQLLQAGPIRARPRVQRAIDLLRIGAGTRVLDIACGRGEVPAIVCQRGGIGIALDYAQAACAFTQRVLAVHDPQGTHSALVRADATRLPFASGSFERVSMLDIIEHLYPPQLEAMFREVARVLAPGGYAVLHTLPNRWVYNITYPLLHRVYPKVPLDPRGPFERKIHINEQTLPDLHAMLARVGLRQRLWLEQHIPAQARWNAQRRDRHADTRDAVYPLLAGWAGRVFELLSTTPAKLLLCNDIFGVLWKDDAAALPRTPLALTERLTVRLAGGRVTPA